MTRMIANKYNVVRLLGKGGMGEVFEVLDSAGNPLALKMFSATGPRADFFRKRFRVEGEILARLSHPRLIKVHEMGIEESSNRPYFTMDLVRGPQGEPLTLESLRQTHTLDECRVASIYADLRSGLDYLHQHGVVHRDVKIDNVLIDADGRPVLTDCGISRIFDPDLKRALAATTTLTGEHAPILGSYGYLAPELKAGKPATPSSDAYALGALVFRLLTGVWYEDDSSAMDLLSGFHPAWTRLLIQLLSRDPNKRLPMPERVVLSQRHWKRWVLALLILLLAGLVVGVVCLKPHTYTFDEFFPASDAEVQS